MNTADLTVTKNGPMNANAGSNVSFDITITNLGPDAALTVSLTDPLPVTTVGMTTYSMTFVSIGQNNGPTFDCSIHPAVGFPGTVTCTIASLAPGASANFTLVATIPPSAPPGTTFTNIATATATGSTDPTSENDSGVTSVTVPIQQADLSVQKTGPPTATPNSDVTFTISVNNGGPDAANSVSLTDTLPGTMTFVSINQNSGPTFDCSSHPTAGSGGTVTCTIDPLPAMSSASFTLVGHIPAGTSGQTFINIANVSSSTNDPNPDNSSQTGVDVASADLKVDSKQGPPTAIASGMIAWTINVSNGGPDQAQSVSLNDSLPAGTTFVSMNQDTGPSATCSTPPVGANGTVSCTWATLNNGGSAQFTLTANINSSFSGTLNNTATISAFTADPDNTNNSKMASTSVTSSADLSVGKAGPLTVTAGSNIVYSITLTNGGPSSAANVTLTDAVPAGTTFVSESQTGGTTFSCTTPAVGGTGNVTCTLASFPPGTATFSITVKTNPSNVGTTISNTATATTTSTDSVPGNNSSTAMTTTTRSADVSVTKTAPSSTTAGSNLTYTIAVTNNGPSDATTVTMTDTLPANTTFVSEMQTTGPSFICANPPAGGTGTVSCSIATLAASASATFSVVVQVLSTAPNGPSSNTAIVTSSADPTPGNNSSTAVTTIAPSVIPMVSPLALLFLAIVLAAAGAVVLKR